MKQILETVVPSILRFGLAAYGSWVAAQSGHEIAVGNPSSTTVLQLVTRLVLHN